MIASRRSSCASHRGRIALVAVVKPSRRAIFRSVFARVGFELTEAVVQDVMVGGELKRAFGEVARARATALAGLERARGEAAALRKLANAARLFREHEGLERLKVLALAERAAESAHNTLVLGLDPRIVGPSKP